MWPLGVLPMRDLLIMDEAHNLSTTLMNHYSMEINHKSLETLFNIPSWEDVKKAKGEVKERLKRRRSKLLTAWNPKDGDDAGFGIPSVPSIRVDTQERVWNMGSKVFSHYAKYLGDILSHNLKNQLYEGEVLRKAKRFLDKLQLITMKLNDWSNWVWSKNDELSPTKVSFKPLSIKDDAEKLIHSSGKQRIFMSATIGDISVFCTELGLNMEDTTFIKLNYSSFDLANRPIYTHLKGGNLTFKGKTEDDYFQTAKAIAEICWKYKDKKGLILPYTKVIQRNVIASLQKYHPFLSGRLRSHTDNTQERDDVFASFNRSNENDVLISTYANQGYDGKDVDFCIIVKLPFGSIADIQVRKKMETNPSWYRAKAATELTQMCGRVVRSKDDVGHTYIIDPSFDYHFDRGVANRPLKTEMPKYVCESIHYNRGIKNV
jgi:Rad3-related DNA helicase